MRSIDLNFVARRDKSLPFPNLAFDEMEGYAGFYVRPQEEEFIWREKIHDARRGVIFISTNYPEIIASTIAHEWRHHWQFFNGFQMDGTSWNSPADYDAAIVEYFTKSKSEADALRFQIRTVGWEKDDQWKEILEGRFVF